MVLEGSETITMTFGAPINKTSTINISDTSFAPAPTP